MAVFLIVSSHNPIAVTMKSKESCNNMKIARKI